MVTAWNLDTNVDIAKYTASKSGSDFVLTQDTGAAGLANMTVTVTHGTSGSSDAVVSLGSSSAGISAVAGGQDILLAASGCSISGVSVLNDVIDSVVYDLGVPHEAWDSCSYMNVVQQLQDVHTLSDVTRIQGKLQQTCSLSMASLVHEISANFDENMGYNADHASSALNKMYGSGLESAISVSMAGDSANSRHVLVLSVMFKNSTPGVRNIEFRLHFLVSDSSAMPVPSVVATMQYGNDGASNAGSASLQELCALSSNPKNFQLDGTQT